MIMIYLFLSQTAYLKRHRLMRSLSPNFDSTTMLMTLEMTPVSTSTGNIPACTTSSTICDVCSLIKLSGLRQGTNTDDIFVRPCEVGKTVVIVSPSVVLLEYAVSIVWPKANVCPDMLLLNIIISKYNFWYEMSNNWIFSFQKVCMILNLYDNLGW